MKYLLRFYNFMNIHQYFKGLHKFMEKIAKNLYILLLQREIPMAWGTTTNNLTPEINPFLYPREIKQLTQTDLESYLILDD